VYTEQLCYVAYLFYVLGHNVECFNAECCYAKCRYDKCRGAHAWHSCFLFSGLKYTVFYRV
jgi:hypothetical protein